MQVQKHVKHEFEQLEHTAMYTMVHRDKKARTEREHLRVILCSRQARNELFPLKTGGGNAVWAPYITC